MVMLSLKPLPEISRIAYLNFFVCAHKESLHSLVIEYLGLIHCKGIHKYYGAAYGA